MAWPEISIDDFPSKRDDEPSSLRQDIIDELTDHFACALNRELLKNPDELTAKQRVLNQFGDPIKIARQLWLDAMKEKIMSQRIMTGISAVMAACCILVVVFGWLMMKENQLVNHQLLEQLAVIADRPQADSTVVKSLQKTNEAIVRELRILTESQQPSRSMGEMGMEGFEGMHGGAMMEGGFGMESKPAAAANINQQILKQLEQLNQKQTAQGGAASEGMNQISIQLVQDNKEKTPAVGFSGKLVKSGAKTDSFSLKEVSDKKGVLDFGNLPWGKYELYLSAPWGDQLSTNISTVPGRNYSETVICPATAAPPVPVQFELNWPDQLKADEWVVICDYRRRGSGGGAPGSLYRKVGNQIWNEKSIPLDQQSSVVLINGDNQVSLCPLDQKGELKNVDLATVDWQSSVNLTAGEGYALSIVYLIPKTELGRLSEVNFDRRYAVLDKFRTTMMIFDQLSRLQPEHGFTGGLSSASATMFVAPFQNPNALKDVGPFDPLPKVAEGMQYPNWLNFSALEDQNNLWTIPVIKLEQLTRPEEVGRSGVIGVNGAGQGFF
ncbi:hypothetical protein Pan241w_44560 [Gimesia alba]|uniref:Uncharacterized protein n=1 Tax=Gimesia alba TaxID=2527973 RepID=A0A517RKE1_9PLAN|nr:prealbumin-like fold domain-containing protein [Gimesia alba]QDT44347.1 hypothetical protein Pan241w_44560 [Gimesia alba]